MNLRLTLVFGALTVLFAPVVFGQQARQRSMFQLPDAGTQLPKVQVHDDQGRPFSTDSLKENYTVLVFGCLT